MRFNPPHFISKNFNQTQTIGRTIASSNVTVIVIEMHKWQTWSEGRAREKK